MKDRVKPDLGPFGRGIFKFPEKDLPESVSKLFIVETDVYYERYELPEDCSAHEQLDGIMFDPFFRSPLYPIDGEGNTPEVHKMLKEKLQIWCERFPGRRSGNRVVPQSEAAALVSVVFRFS